MHEGANLTVIRAPCNNKSCGSGVKQRIAALLCSLISFIVLSQRCDELSFSCNASDNFEVVENEGSLFNAQTFVYFVVASEA